MLYPDFESFEKSKGVSITGATQIFVAGSTAKLHELNSHSSVILVDIGYANEVLEEKAKGNAAGMNKPANLYHWYDEFK